jgi:hypothetical protein
MAYPAGAPCYDDRTERLGSASNTVNQQVLSHHSPFTAMGRAMRKLDNDELELLEQLGSGLPTDALIAMVRDLAAVLTKEGLAVRARVAQTAADRLEQLSAARAN